VRIVDTQKILLISGGVLLLLGLGWPLIQKIGLGKLPGDLSWEGQGYGVYFPLTTMILVSLILTLLLNIIPRLFR